MTQCSQSEQSSQSQQIIPSSDDISPPITIMVKTVILPPPTHLSVHHPKSVQNSTQSSPQQRTHPEHPEVASIFEADQGWTKTTGWIDTGTWGGRYGIIIQCSNTTSTPYHHHPTIPSYQTPITILPSLPADHTKQTIINHPSPHYTTITRPYHDIQPSLQLTAITIPHHQIYTTPSDLYHTIRSIPHH